MALTREEKGRTLKNFMEEFFDFNGLKKVGFYSKDIKKDDYEAQAKRVCDLFGYDIVYEFGAKDVSTHISYVEGHRPKGEGFITHFESIYK